MVFGFRRNKVSDLQYEHEGYQIFSQALNADAVRNVIEAIKSEVFPHKEPLLRHTTGRMERHVRFREDAIYNQLLDPHLAKTLPVTSAALTDLVCSAELRRCLNQIDGEDEYTVHQVILFFVGPSMGIHIDGWFFDTSPLGYAHTVWIPLEDLTQYNGPVFVYPTPRGRFLDAAELGLDGHFSARDDEALSRYYDYQDAVLAWYRRSQRTVVTAQLKTGDFVVWSSLTPHGSFPAHPVTTRLSMQVLIRPSRYDWGRFQDILVDKKPRQEKGDAVRPGWRVFPMT